MIRTLRNLMIVTHVMAVSVAGLANSRECSHKERYIGAGERCTDTNPDDVIALGSLRVQPDGLPGIKKVVLHDEERGDIDLILTHSLIQAVDESPAESYEVEGSVTNGQMIVKSLRPIE